MPSFVLLFSLLSLSSLKSEEIKLQLILHSSKDKFEKTKDDEEWFSQVDGKIEFSYRSEFRVIGEPGSKKNPLTSKSARDRIRYVAGKDDGGRGHSKMKITEIDGAPTLELSSALVRIKNASYPNVFPKREEKLNDLKEGDDFDIVRQSATYELDWVKGSWVDYQNKEDVELRFSKAGTKSYLTDFRAQVAAEVWAAILKMKAKEALEPEGSIWIKTLKKNKEESLDFRGRIRGNRDRFEVDWISVQVDVTAKVQTGRTD